MTKTVIYSSPYVPAEWIAAHGLRPSRIMPGAAGLTSSVSRVEGICPYARSFINEVVTNTQAAGVVMTTVCDQMRRAFEMVTRRCELPAFLMNVPNTWQHVTVQKLYLDELRRLGRFLERLGGVSPSADVLAKIMLDYDAARASIVASRAYLTSRQYSQMIAEFGRDGDCSIVKGATGSQPSTGGIPLAILGGPLLRDDFEIFDVVEDSGGRIVLDGTESGERGMCARFDRRQFRDHPLVELSNAYFGSIPDASDRPNSRLYAWLKRELACRGVQGIILRRYVWCDIWHAELRRLQEWTDLPVLDVDVSDNGQAMPVRTTHRIRAFLEMLQ